LAFNSEFQNEPIISENPIFVKQWFKKYESDSEVFKRESAQGLYTVVSVDPAISKQETADYTAIVSVSATFGNESKFYVRKPIRGHWTLNQTVSEAVKIYDQYQASALIVETTAYQEALADEIRRFCDDNRRYIRILEIKPDKDKERRAHVVAPLLEQGRVYFDHNDEMTQKLMEEMIVFPTGDRDDMVDSLVYCLTELKYWQVRRPGNITSALDGKWD
jgi:predicted phage terminase large subunit-like protein